MSESEAAEIATPMPLEVERPRRDERRAERATVKAAQRGSADAIERLVRERWPEAHRVALGILGDPAGAEDVAQDAMLAAIRALPSFDRRRPVRPWLHRIVVNRALDAWRARERRAEAELTREVLGSHDVAAPQPAGDLASLLAALDPRERAIVVLRHLIGLNSTEIADVLEIPDGTVRSSLARALARLRDDLDEEDYRD